MPPEKTDTKNVTLAVHNSHYDTLIVEKGSFLAPTRLQHWQFAYQDVFRSVPKVANGFHKGSCQKGFWSI